MSEPKHRYAYRLTSGHLPEYEAVVFAYTQAGWVEVAALPESGLPTHIIFEWQKDCPPIYPSVNWP